MKHFHHPPKGTLFPLAVTPNPLSPQLLSITNLLSVSTDLPILGISYKENHRICGLLCLASFTQHVVKVHPCWNVAVLHFFSWLTTCCCMHMLHFIYSFISWWTFELLASWTRALCTFVYKFVWTYVLSSLGYIAGSGIVESYSSPHF